MSLLLSEKNNILFGASFTITRIGIGTSFGGVTGLSPTVQIRDLFDHTGPGTYLDFGDGVFKSPPTISPNLACTDMGKGTYGFSLDLSSVVWPAGHYVFALEYRNTGAGVLNFDLQDILVVVDNLNTLSTLTLTDILADSVAFNGADIATILGDTNDIQTRLPAALVGGRMDSDVGAIQAGAVNAAAIATNAVDADALATDAVNEIRDAILADSTPFNGASVAAILADTAAIEPLVSTNLDATISSVLTAIGALNDLSIADVQTALTNQGYTAARAAFLDEAISAAKTLTVAERDAVANALLDLANSIETGFNVRGALRIMAAAVAGETTGGPAGFNAKGLDQSTVRIAGSATIQGDRSVTTYTP